MGSCSCRSIGSRLKWQVSVSAWGFPKERKFATKIELGWTMIQRVQAHGLPFEAVACDDLYGRVAGLGIK